VKINVRNSLDYHVAETRILCNPQEYVSKYSDFNGALVFGVNA
jgi:hypothetical protein